MPIRFPSALDVMTYVEKPESPAPQPKPMKKERLAIAEKAISTKIATSNPIATKESRHGKYADKEKRLAYMREANRKSRATKKAKSNQNG